MRYRSIVVIFLLSSNFTFAVTEKQVSGEQPAVVVKKTMLPQDTGKAGNHDDDKHWNLITKATQLEQQADNLASSVDPNSYFEIKRKTTESHVSSSEALTSSSEVFLREREVELANTLLYNVGSKGEPAPGDPNLELYDTHIKLFCSPLSGYEGKISKQCNQANPLILQHADLKPIVLADNKFGLGMISMAKNWINNFLTALTDADVPAYIKDPSLLADTKYMTEYVRRLRLKIPVFAAANSLNVMLAKRIPINPEDKDSQSLASSLAAEVNGRHLNNEWHTAVSQSTKDLDIAKEQLRVLALISHQLQELNERVERLELLNAALITTSVNQQEDIYKGFKALKKGAANLRRP